MNAVVIERRIAMSADDAEESASGGAYHTSSDLELVNDIDHNRFGQTVGLRFAGLDIPQGAVVTNAWLQFQVDEAGSGPASLEIRAHATDDAPAFTRAVNDISSRPTTSAVVDWQPGPWTDVGKAGPDQRTPDLNAVVGEIAGREGWAPGNAMAFIITGTGTRVAEAFDGDPAAAPLLHIEYETASPQTLVSETPVPETAGRVQAFDIVDAVAGRLEKAGIYQEVLGALDAAALGDWPRGGTAFVVPLAETAAGSVAPAVGAVQRVETTVAVHTLIDAPNDPTGGKVREELAATLDASRRALSGWRPEGAAEVLAYRRGLLLGLENGLLEWRDEYALVWWIEAGAGADSSGNTDPNLPPSMRGE